MNNDQILLVGGGKMGEAMLAGWLKHGIPKEKLYVIEFDASRTTFLRATYGVDVGRELPAGGAPSAVVFAIKPQIMAETLPSYAALLKTGSLCLSIAAGKTLAFLGKHLGEATALVRAMPNLPAAIGAGVTVACSNQHVTPAQKALAEKLCGAVGAFHWIEEEHLLDAVTALSGSGPAYVFLLMEAMIQAGVTLGLPASLAADLAKHTVKGSALLAAESPYTPTVLREQVTSPKGTTAAALDVLMRNHGLFRLIEEGMMAAAERSQVLAE